MNAGMFLTPEEPEKQKPHNIKLHMLKYHSAFTPHMQCPLCLRKATTLEIATVRAEGDKNVVYIKHSVRCVKCDTQSWYSVFSDTNPHVKELRKALP